jgi:hypothetical protein
MKRWAYVPGKEKGCFARLFTLAKAEVVKRVNWKKDVKLKLKRNKHEMSKARSKWQKQKAGSCNSGKRWQRMVLGSRGRRGGSREARDQFTNGYLSQ